MPRAPAAEAFDTAIKYRELNGIPASWGTAVNVQQMVFGNKGDSSCSGVAFSRDGRRLALTLEGGRALGDVYVLDLDPARHGVPR